MLWHADDVYFIFILQVIKKSLLLSTAVFKDNDERKRIFQFTSFTPPTGTHYAVPSFSGAPHTMKMTGLINTP